MMNTIYRLIVAACQAFGYLEKRYLASQIIIRVVCVIREKPRFRQKMVNASDNKLLPKTLHALKRVCKVFVTYLFADYADSVGATRRALLQKRPK